MEILRRLTRVENIDIRDRLFQHRAEILVTIVNFVRATVRDQETSDEQLRLVRDQLKTAQFIFTVEYENRMKAIVDLAISMSERRRDAQTHGPDRDFQFRLDTDRATLINDTAELQAKFASEMRARGGLSVSTRPRSTGPAATTTPRLRPMAVPPPAARLKATQLPRLDSGLLVG